MPKGDAAGPNDRKQYKASSSARAAEVLTARAAGGAFGGLLPAAPLVPTNAHWVARAPTISVSTHPASCSIQRTLFMHAGA
ncbi:hypothetical protein HaLaN_06304 [Haematococcus lacustris]|uniref:Uncharacterized protein n=1 Tax=Haematococcus lacustris TaxID=44745 RepID=A0A699Z619_HAELA|nr:hypothetical protein HaLaN_06304 [Haematococcus lacustris]